MFLEQVDKTMRDLFNMPEDKNTIVTKKSSDALDKKKPIIKHDLVDGCEVSIWLMLAKISELFFYVILYFECKS